MHALPGALALLASAAATAQVAAAPSPPPVVAYALVSQEPSLTDSRFASSTLIGLAAGLGGVVGSAALGGAVGLAEAARGSDILVNDEVVNPAPALARGLAGAYAQSRGYRFVDRPVYKPAGEYRWWAPAGAILDEDRPIDFVVVVDPATLSLSNGAFHWARSELRYEDKAWILEASTERVVAKASCRVRPSQASPPPTRKAMLADDGALLKRLIGLGSDQCSAQILSSLKMTARSPEAPSPAPPATAAASASLGLEFKREETEAALAYALGESHALHQACGLRPDESSRSRMVKILDAAAADPPRANLLATAFNSGYSVAQDRHPGCDDDARAEAARVAVALKSMPAAPLEN